MNKKIEARIMNHLNNFGHNMLRDDCLICVKLKGYVNGRLQMIEEIFIDKKHYIMNVSMEQGLRKERDKLKRMLEK